MTFAFNLAQLANNVNSSGQLSLTAGVTGILPQANGGTGNSSLAAVAVTSLTAGSGISLSGSVGSVTITNTGGAGGATTSSSSADITLTNSSNRVQSISMSTYGKRVILPDATTISTLGGPLFILVNNGIYTFDVCTADGYVLAYLEAGESMSVALSSAASANANWITDKTGLVGLTTTQSTTTNFTNAQSTVSWATPADIQVSALSSSSVIIGYIDRTTSDLYAVVATISGTTISYGTPLAVLVGSVTNVNICALSSTAAFIATRNGSTNTTYALVISGTTITSSPAATQSAQYPVVLRKLDSTRVIQIYNSTAGSSTSVRILQHNGTSAITVGTGVNFTSAANYQNQYSGQQADVVTIDTNKFVLFWGGGLARVGTVSTTTITLGTTSANLTVAGQNISSLSQVFAYAYSTTECGMIFCAIGTSNLDWQTEMFTAVCNISGTGATWGNITRIGNLYNARPLGKSVYFDGAGNTVPNLNFNNSMNSFAQMDTTTAIATFSMDNNYYKLKYIPTVGWKNSGSCSANDSPFGWGVASLSSTSAFVVGNPVVENNGNTLGVPYNTRAALIKIPT